MEPSSQVSNFRRCSPGKRIDVKIGTFVTSGYGYVFLKNLKLFLDAVEKYFSADHVRLDEILFGLYQLFASRRKVDSPLVGRGLKKARLSEYVLLKKYLKKAQFASL